MTIVEALKELVTAIGGIYTADDDTVSEIVEKLTAAFESGEFVTNLPAVTAADNGKLFGVTGGAWGKVDAPVELPAVAAVDNGSVLGVVGGAWAKDSRTIAVIGTIGENEQNKTTITLNKTAAEFYEAVSYGKQVKISATIGESLTGEFIVWIDSFKFTSDDVTVYTFRFVNQEGTVYLADNLSANDTVVLVEQ